MTKICPEDLLDDGKYLWSKLLEDVKDNTSMKLPPQRLLIVLGDEESGKTSLMSHIHGSDEPKKSYGLEYQYVDIKDEFQDDQTKLGAYSLGGSIYLSNLIKFALNESNFGDAMAMIVVSMHEPWTIMDSLNTWYDVLRSHCERLRIDPYVREEYKQSLVRYYQEYVEPSSQNIDESQKNQISLLTSRRHTNPLHPQSLSHSSNVNGTPTTPTDSNQDKVTLPLPEGVLEFNLGIPLVVVVTKTDLMDSLAKEYNFTEEHFEVIQMHIRRFCLARGAALIFTSVKEEKNCDLLRGYLKNRMYGLPFSHSAYVVEKDCVFVPTGWDNLKKIKILEENLVVLKGKSKFTECIPRPVRSKPSSIGHRDAEISATDEQKFLENLMTGLEVIGSRHGAAADTDLQMKKSPINRPTAAGHVNAIKTKSPYVSTSTVPKDGDGVLANFFNSLLKKTNSPGMPGTVTAPLTTTATTLPSQENEKNAPKPVNVHKSLKAPAAGPHTGKTTDTNGPCSSDKEASSDVES